MVKTTDIELNKVYTARDYARREGYKSVRERIISRSQVMVQRRELDTPYVDTKPTGEPVYARIDFQRWVADCECGGAEAVDPDEPIFYCFSCGNFTTGGRPRPVVFPGVAERLEIEQAVLARPITVVRGTTDLDRAVNVIVPHVPGLGGLSRSWNPGETVAEIKRQNALLNIKGE